MEPSEIRSGEREAPSSMEQLISDYDYQLPQRGDIRSGVIVSIEPSEIVVDIGVKRDGIVPSRDLDMLGKEEVSKLKVGHEVNVYVLRPEDAQGNMIVSINIARRQQDWVHTEKMQESGELFEGEVIDFNKGGLLVPFGNLRGFIPASQLSDLPRGLSQSAKMDRLKEYVGQTLPLKVIEVDRRRRRLILSERAARRRWREQQKEQLLESLVEGQVRRGIVSGLADFGAFVDLGGADGLIHVSELSWDRVSHPREVLDPGQEVEVYVLRLDYERKRIGLSLKRLQPDPWSAVEGNYEIDQVVRGTITNVVDFGAFACVEPGIEGLIHVSEIADAEVRHPSDVVEVDEEVWVRVISIDSQRKRMGLSLRQVPPMEEPEPAESPEDAIPEGAEEPEAEQIASTVAVDEEVEADEVAVTQLEAGEVEADEVAVTQAEAGEGEADEVAVTQAEAVEPEIDESGVTQLEAEEADADPDAVAEFGVEEPEADPVAVVELGAEELESDLAPAAEEDAEIPAADLDSDTEEEPTV